MTKKYEKNHVGSLRVKDLYGIHISGMQQKNGVDG